MKYFLRKLVFVHRLKYIRISSIDKNTVDFIGK